MTFQNIIGLQAVKIAQPHYSKGIILIKDELEAQAFVALYMHQVRRLLQVRLHHVSEALQVDGNDLFRSVFYGHAHRKHVCVSTVNITHAVYLISLKSREG